MTLPELMAAPQYSLPQREKERILVRRLNELTEHHRSRCPECDRLLRILHHDPGPAGNLGAVPYVPAGLFKTHELRSIPRSEVFKVLTSSGTTGQQVSRVFLDRETARLQAEALSRVMMHVLGPGRLPMLILDTLSVLRDRTQIGARGAGILGMSNFGRSHRYALDENYQLDREAVLGFLRSFGAQPFLMFGFTFIVWAYFYERIRDAGLDLSNGILIHSGGWKALEERAVTNEAFREAFLRHTGLARIYNFYGMAEQAGSVFLEGEDGLLYAPNFADVVVRDPVTWEELPPGRPGVLEVLSLLPRSYPGHAILTEDLGVVVDIDGGGCQRQGKGFRVLGRVPQTELRGCSDTHAASVAA